MNTIKYIAIQIFALILVISVVLGIGAAESNMWFQAILFLFGPFGIGYVFDFNNMVHYCEVYERAWSISMKSNS